MLLIISIIIIISNIMATNTINYIQTILTR